MDEVEKKAKTNKEKKTTTKKTIREQDKKERKGRKEGRGWR